MRGGAREGLEAAAGWPEPVMLAANVLRLGTERFLFDCLLIWGVAMSAEAARCCLYVYCASSHGHGKVLPFSSCVRADLEMFLENSFEVFFFHTGLIDTCVMAIINQQHLLKGNESPNLRFFCAVKY